MITIMSDLSQAQAQLEQAKAELEAAILQAGESTPPAAHETKPPGAARGIETMFRSVYAVQMDLTGLADNKANMMISINGIIMSIIIAAVAPKLDANPWLLVPTSVLLIGNLVSLVFAVLAARPRISRPVFDSSAPRRSEGNLLFFGTFANMREDNYVLAMEELMKDKTLVYESMIRNIYGLGSVLYRKFVLLRYAYSSFMVALILGVFSFLGVFAWLAQRGP